MNFLPRFSAGALALGLPLLVATPGMAAASADSPAPAQSLRYQSAFADYKPYQDVQSGDWKALNDTVRDSGDGPMRMGSMNRSHHPASAMPMGGSHPMPSKKPADKQGAAVSLHRHGDHAMSGDEP